VKVNVAGSTPFERFANLTKQVLQAGPVAKKPVKKTKGAKPKAG
jgi:hypothetical protein